MKQPSQTASIKILINFLEGSNVAGFWNEAKAWRELKLKSKNKESEVDRLKSQSKAEKKKLIQRLNLLQTKVHVFSSVLKVTVSWNIFIMCENSEYQKFYSIP